MGGILPSKKLFFRSTLHCLIAIALLLFVIGYMLGTNRSVYRMPDISTLRRDAFFELVKQRNTTISRSAQTCTRIPVDAGLPFIYAVTPTYTRPIQKAEFVRLKLAFLNVDNFHWIVVEDSSNKTALVTKFLNVSGLKYTHLNVKTQEAAQVKDKEHRTAHPRGVDQRNAAIDWLLNNSVKPGVIYFADDDNTYSPELFKEMRFTHRVSVWPVGLVGGLRFESPLVSPTTGKVTGWHAEYNKKRAFAMDMAGFAINLEVFRNHTGARFDISKLGETEGSLLTALNVTLDDLEPKADNCTKVYVWHTRSEKPVWNYEKELIKNGRPSDPDIEV